MSLPRRLCLLLFGMCATFSLGALTLPWFGPWTERAAELLSTRWYYLVVEGCLAVTAAGVAMVLLQALFTPPRRKVVEVARVDGDSITVAVTAISAQASYAVGRSGRFATDRIRVKARKHSADVAIRVHPNRPVNVIEEGPRLHTVVTESLATLLGGAVGTVSLEFVESDAYGTQPVTSTEVDVTPSETDVTQGSDVGEEARTPIDARRDITVSMRAARGTNDDGEPVVRGE